jgi:galactokinase
MTGRDMADVLSRHGLTTTEGEARRALFDRALAAFQEGGATPTHAWWVPGRLEVFGKHTDYAGGRTLIAAVPRGFMVLAAPRRDAEIHVRDARSSESMAIAERPGSFSGWRHYVEVVVRRLVRNFPDGAGGPWHARRGVTIVFASDLPRASGMSSSSALLVGVASALTTLWNLTERPEWTANIGGPQDVAGYFACLENGRTFKGLRGDSGVGTHGGSEDHTAMLLARPGDLSAYAFLPVRHLADVPLPAAWSFVIASSGVPAAKTGSARGAYNRLADAVALLLRLWNEGDGPRADSLASALADPEARRRLRERVSSRVLPGWPAGDLVRRLEHFIVEDGIVPEAVAAFAGADAAALGRLSATSQDAAERLLGNQVPATVELVRLARANGAFAACGFGAGFGGSVWALVPRAESESFARTWLERYRTRFPDRETAETIVARPGPPLTALTE